MKKILFLFGFLFSVTLFNNSCYEIDECKDVVCENGDCVLGSCHCDYGWGGSDCSTKKISYFTGDWTGELKCLTNTDTITLKVKEIGNSVDVLKINTVDLVFNVGSIPISFDSYTLNAVVDSGFNSFVIDTLEIKQQFNGQEFLVLVTGNGKKLEEEKLGLNLDFSLENQGFTIKCEGVFEK